MMEQSDYLLAHMKNLADKAAKTGTAASRFLTPTERQSVAEFFKHRRDVAFSFDGGFENAERTRAVFTNPGWGDYDRAGLFSALKVAYRPQDTLTHRDILGALMALGIERYTIGDILCGEGLSSLVCLPEIGGYITENLTKAGRIGITVTEIDLDELPIKQEELTVKTDTVASLRLDAVLCAAFGLSRTKAAELITAGRVNVNHQLCEQPAKELCEGSLLSVRGMGRAKLLEVGGMSKKGRIFIRIGIYGR
jgi:RNA-binding protein YlmH